MDKKASKPRRNNSEVDDTTKNEETMEKDCASRQVVIRLKSLESRNRNEAETQEEKV